MVGSLHTALTEGVLAAYPQAKTTGFLKALREHVLDDPEDLIWIAETREVAVIPDAYFVDAENMAVVAIEVEVSHSISEEKMARYHDLAWLLDWCCWNLVVVRVDRHGTRRAIDAYTASLEQIVREAQ